MTITVAPGIKAFLRLLLKVLIAAAQLLDTWLANSDSSDLPF